MTAAWKKYQEEAADFFRSLGYVAEIEKKVKGVRGFHKVDVMVSGTIHGIEFSWVVECKHWKGNIPKEKVMALMSIVQDVGADKGFLLSEVGFQSGAIRASNNSNITLTSIADLSSEAKDSLAEIIAAKLHLKISTLKRKLLQLHRDSGEYYSEHATAIGKLVVLEMALGDAIEEKFPTVYSLDKDIRLSANNWDEFLLVSDKIISEVQEVYESANK